MSEVGLLFLFEVARAVKVIALGEVTLLLVRMERSEEMDDDSDDNGGEGVAAGTTGLSGLGNELGLNEVLRRNVVLNFFIILAAVDCISAGGAVEVGLGCCERNGEGEDDFIWVAGGEDGTPLGLNLSKREADDEKLKPRMFGLIGMRGGR